MPTPRDTDEDEDEDKSGAATQKRPRSPSVLTPRPGVSAADKRANLLMDRIDHMTVDFAKKIGHLLLHHDRSKTSLIITSMRKNPELLDRLKNGTLSPEELLSLPAMQLRPRAVQVQDEIALVFQAWP